MIYSVHYGVRKLDIHPKSATSGWGRWDDSSLSFVSEMGGGKTKSVSIGNITDGSLKSMSVPVAICTRNSDVCVSSFVFSRIDVLVSIFKVSQFILFVKLRS